MECSLLQNDGAIRGPTQIDLIAPIDRPLGSAAIVLCKNGHQLAGLRLDAVRGAIAEIAQLPHHALDLIHPAAVDRLLAQAYLLRAQGNPHTLTAAESAKLIDGQVATGFCTAHDDSPAFAAAH